MIDTAGKINNAKVLKGVDNCSECDTEALRVIKLMPDWFPGSKNGVKIPVIYYLPLNFNLKYNTPIAFSDNKNPINIQAEYPVDARVFEKKLKEIFLKSVTPMQPI